jgi:hypothetical protein
MVAHQQLTGLAAAEAAVKGVLEPMQYVLEHLGMNPLELVPSSVWAFAPRFV